MRRFDCSDPDERAEGLKFCAGCIRRGAVVVLPTDTLYGIAADAFSSWGVQQLLDAKGRGRDMPVPVLIGRVETVDGIATDLSDDARELISAFWPGALTLIARAQPSLQWDLGETQGTVAVRMPLHPVALELLAETGPLAVSSANRSGSPPATTVEEAMGQLGELVDGYLDGGPCPQGQASTIVDVTGEVPVVRRLGAVSLQDLRSVVPGITAPEG